MFCVNETEIGEYVGEWLGLLLYWFFIIWGTAKCMFLARRPGANAKGFYALAAALVVWVLPPLVDSLIIWLGFRHPVRMFSYYASLSLVIAPIVLAVLSLGEISRDPQRFARGKKQAICALVVSVVLIMMGSGYLTGMMRRPGDELVFEEMNFKFRAPPEPWFMMDMVDVKKISKDGILGFVRESPDTEFIVIVEDLGIRGAAMSIEAKAEAMKDALKKIAMSFRVVDEQTMQWGDLRGLQVVLEDQASGGSVLRYVVLVLIHGGYAYQLVTIGDSAEQTEAETRMSAESMMINFDLNN